MIPAISIMGKEAISITVHYVTPAFSSLDTKGSVLQKVHPVSGHRVQSKMLVSRHMKNGDARCQILVKETAN